MYGGGQFVHTTVNPLEHFFIGRTYTADVGVGHLLEKAVGTHVGAGRTQTRKSIVGILHTLVREENQRPTQKIIIIFPCFSIIVFFNNIVVHVGSLSPRSAAGTTPDAPQRPHANTRERDPAERSDAITLGDSGESAC